MAQSTKCIMNCVIHNTFSDFNNSAILDYVNLKIYFKIA